MLSAVVGELPDSARRNPERLQYSLYKTEAPLRHAQMPAGPDIRINRRLRYGTLADLTVIDTRSYRDDQPCGDGDGVDCADRLDPNRTILGAAQRDWLLTGLSRSRARWQILGNQAPMGQTDRDVRNLVVITGDRHQNYAWDLKRDYADPTSPTVASEFVGTSITSGGDGADMNTDGVNFLAANPHLKFFNAQRGYVRVNVDRQRWRSDFRVLPHVQQQGAPVTTRASYVVEDRVPGVQQA
ncbi:alkaline phosphatase D family protein [Actinophytocola oryzae]|uniref:PhoD-like phosphatase n=1 Tax=Actinophytocola oryzae TaxID=502181 RepID=A0A4R7VKC7_9PSEU|nr:alkaline phosphatase D family protein [Actinophytocola oryzae]TDV49697.1 PhoD-like phosphatase [Actinophytocola oryzae]